MQRIGPLPAQSLVGFLVLAVSWSASWSGRTPLAYHAFFPLWLGYILLIDGLVWSLSGSSLLTRDLRRFVALFAVSVPYWWVFEALNARLQNWSYHLPYRYSWLAYHAEASLAFSTVVPALFETAELWSLFISRRAGRWRALDLSDRGWLAFAGVGVLMLALVIAAPRTMFPLTWLALFFIVDPLVHLSGGASIASRVAIGSWRVVEVLMLSGITCGLLWEGWNWRAMPKWTYNIPYANWLHLFEMPLLGYGGYLPFALGTYAFVKLVDRLFPFLGNDFLAFDRIDAAQAGRRSR